MHGCIYLQSEALGSLGYEPGLRSVGLNSKTLTEKGQG